MSGFAFLSICKIAQNQENSLNSSSEIKIILNNLEEQIRNTKYKELISTFSEKEFSNLSPSYNIKTSIDTKNPCSKGICDLTIINIKVYDLTGVLVATTNVDRAYTHFTNMSQVNYSGGIATVLMDSNITKIKYKLWGAGGGTGGNDQSAGSIGGAGGAVVGNIDNSNNIKQINIIVGQSGINGGGGGGTAGAEGATYGGGGDGGGTGWYGSSGAGASGGGRTSILVDSVEYSTAGGGGGGGGGSYNRGGLQGSLCSTQVINSFVGGKGQTSPVDGGGGGGGGGGHWGGIGGHYGADESRGGINAAGGCYGGSYTIDDTAIIYNPFGSTTGNFTDINRGTAGSPGKDGKAILIIERESDSSI